MEATLEILMRMEEKLALLDKISTRRKVVVGFDGFNSIRRVVHRRGSSEVNYYKTLNDLPVLCTALNALELHTDCIGSGDYIEFDTLEKYDWEYIREKVGLERLRRVIVASDLVAMVDWANLAHAEDIWEGIVNDILIPSGRRNYMFLFDLCDLSGRNSYEIDDILDVISRFSYCGMVTVSLNEKELMSIWAALTGKANTVSIEEAGRFLHYAINIDCLLIHLTDRCIVFHHRQSVELRGRTVSSPRAQTGGGDSLNAGYVLGALSGMTLSESVTLGMASSGFFVQEGFSPDLPAIRNYITAWKHELREKIGKTKPGEPKVDATKQDRKKHGETGAGKS